MGELLILLAAVFVFWLAWLGVGLVPEPKVEPPAKQPFSIRWVLYLAIIVIAIWWLVTRYGLV